MSQATEGTEAKHNIGKAGSAVKEGVISSLKGINEIEAEIVSLVRNTVSNTLRATSAVAGETVGITKDVIKGAMQATEEVGTGLILSTKSVAKGVVMGVSDVGGDIVSVSGQTVRAPSRALPRSARILPWWPAGPSTA